MIHWNAPRLLAARRRTVLAGAAALPLAGACTPKQVVDALLPAPPPYPDWPDRAAVDAEARRQSDVLRAHVEAWLDGRAPAALPRVLLPNGLHPDERSVRLARPEDVAPEAYWIVRPAQDRLDFARLRGLYPDPHCTYMVPGLFWLPFDATATIEGEFPHARYFALQVSPPFDPRVYYYDGAFGAPEVPIVDVDIEPLPGHANPFRAGADRNATRRGWRVEFVMAQGDGPALEPAYRPPHWRAPGNRRLGGPIVYQGPLAKPGGRGHARGVWGAGALWVRYYAPDRAAGPLGGVPLPRVHYALPDGRRFLVVADKGAKETRLNREFAARTVAPRKADPAKEGPTVGWFRELDIFHSGVVGIYRGTGKDSPAEKATGRALVLGATGTGAGQPAPGWYMNSASRSANIAYLVRGVALERDGVIVLTGRLPRHPRTRDGEARMQPGQVRYFSLTTYPEPDLFRLDEIGIALTSVMDDEIVIDGERRYAIAYSRAAERPRNATATNGVTWIDWGPASVAGWTLRWLTVHPDTKDAPITPDDALIPYDRASWLSGGWDEGLVSRNDRPGVMGAYLPRVHAMSRAAFEALGDGPLARRIPPWTG